LCSKPALLFKPTFVTALGCYRGSRQCSNLGNSAHESGHLGTRQAFEYRHLSPTARLQVPHRTLLALLPHWIHAETVGGDRAIKLNRLRPVRLTYMRTITYTGETRSQPCCRCTVTMGAHSVCSSRVPQVARVARDFGRAPSSLEPPRLDDADKCPTVHKLAVSGPLNSAYVGY